MSEIKQEWKLPKNIRQIGDGSGERKIYVEDYVITYLNQLSESDNGKKAILFGEVKEKNQCPYIFADGALEVESFHMDDGAREALLGKIEKYFSGKRIVGWFLAAEESPFVMKREIVEIFQREFSGENQILLVRDRQEKETAVFMLENEMPVEQAGYYIYYDKNTVMQEFMISNNEGKSVDSSTEVKDDAIKRFRKIIKSKKQEAEKTEKETARGRMPYLAGGFLMMTVLALGITMVYNYDRMKEVERSLAKLTNNVDSQREYVTDGEDQAAPVMLHIEEEASSEGEVSSQGESQPEVQTEEVQAEERQTEALQTMDNGGASGETAENQSASEADTAGEKTAEASTAPRASYTVKVGDTLAGISQMYYGNLERVEEICTLNGISDENTILPGQKILLP